MNYKISQIIVIIIIIILSSTLILNSISEDIVHSNPDSLANKEALNASDTRQADIETIKKRYQKHIWNIHPSAYSYDFLDDLIVNETGYFFSSVDYDSERAASWPVQMHLKYLTDLLRIGGKDKLDSDMDLRETAIGLLDYWLENDFISPANWYPNDIGVPKMIAEASLMLDDYLTEEQQKKIDVILDRGTLGRNKVIEKMIGANLSDFIQITLMHGLISGEGALLEKAKEEIENLICIEKWGKDGIQADQTFYAHNNVLVTAGSYGTVFSSNITMFFVMLYGTQYEISKGKEKLFVDFVLDGERYFHRNFGTANFCIGRFAVYCRGGQDIFSNLKKMIDLEHIYRKEELIRYYESYSDFSKVERTGKYFPLSGTIVSISPVAYYAARGCQKGNGLTDVINNQGVLNYNLSYGSNTSYMYYGDEYSSIGAVFDFAMYPGTTAYYETDDELLQRYNEGFNVTWGRIARKDTKCEGYYDETNGLCILKTDLVNDGIRGNNLFIFYKDTAYVLGASFSCDQTSKTIITTVDQCLAETDNANQILKKGMSITNRAFLYTNLCDNDMQYICRKQSGNYKRGDSAGEDTELTENVCVIFYDWGTSLDNTCYAYSVKPILGDGNNTDVIRIENNDKCQIIEFSDGLIAGYSYDHSQYIDLNGAVHNFEKNRIVIE